MKHQATNDCLRTGLLTDLTTRLYCISLCGRGVAQSIILHSSFLSKSGVTVTLPFRGLPSQNVGHIGSIIQSVGTTQQHIILLGVTSVFLLPSICRSYSESPISERLPAPHSPSEPQASVLLKWNKSKLVNIPSSQPFPHQLCSTDTNLT